MDASVSAIAFGDDAAIAGATVSLVLVLTFQVWFIAAVAINVRVIVVALA
jgi:hypothetical protein